MKIFLRVWILIGISAVYGGTKVMALTRPSLIVRDLKCAYRGNPRGVDMLRPELEWIVESRTPSLRGLTQRYYRILVASSSELLQRDTGDFWDSGKINSAKTLGIAYAGKVPESHQTLYWKVRVWDQNGSQSNWSSVNTLTMGLLKEASELMNGLPLLFTFQFSVGQKKLMKWQPYDLAFTSASIPSNPFDVHFSAEVSGPDGIKLAIPGFYDGNNRWVIRFAPTKEGKWTVKTQSDISSLNNQIENINCIANTNQHIHGALGIDDSKRHFRYEDGTRFFPAGYEANWLWALDENDDSLPTLNLFLDKLQSYGFNFMLINAYSYDTSWRSGKTEGEDYGPSALYPWSGNNDSLDFSRFNLKYWQHYDKMMDALYKRGMGAHIYFKVYNKKVNWMPNNSREDDNYYRWIIARYAAYPTVTWDLAKEANYEKSVAYKVDRLKFIRSNDPYKRLLTVHTDIQTYNKGIYNDLVDFRTHQEQSNHLNETTLKQLEQNLWPVFNAESGYEQGTKGPNDKTYSRANTPEEVAKAIWQVQMAGGYNAYYYTYGAWDIIHTQDTPIGYTYFKNFTNFFNTTTYWLLKSSNSLTNSGYCLANKGKEYIVFQDSSKAFQLKLEGIVKPLNANWFNPLTGNYRVASKVKNGNIDFFPPKEWGSGPVVLHISEN